MTAQKLASLRAAIYGVAAAIGAICVANGIITGEQLATYLPFIPAVFALVVAVLNVRPHAEPIDIDALVNAVITQAVNIMTAPAAPANPNGDHYDPQANEKLAEYLLDKPATGVTSAASDDSAESGE